MKIMSTIKDYEQKIETKMQYINRNYYSPCELNSISSDVALYMQEAGV
jgi:hypothetical protein